MNVKNFLKNWIRRSVERKEEKGMEDNTEINRVTRPPIKICFAFHPTSLLRSLAKIESQDERLKGSIPIGILRKVKGNNFWGKRENPILPKKNQVPH